MRCKSKKAPRSGISSPSIGWSSIVGYVSQERGNVHAQREMSEYIIKRRQIRLQNYGTLFYMCHKCKVGAEKYRGLATLTGQEKLNV